MTIAELRALAPDWDTEGAMAPMPRAIDSTERLLRLLATPPDVAACPDGTIDLWWPGGLLINVRDDGLEACEHERFPTTD